MTRRTAAGWHAYDDVGELLSELELERGELDVVTLSTLRAYVRALGGSLRVVADFGDREYRLT